MDIGYNWRKKKLKKQFSYISFFSDTCFLHRPISNADRCALREYRIRAHNLLRYILKYIYYTGILAYKDAMRR